MKILLTGLPKSGKSTMLTNLIAGVGPKHGLTSPEVRENGGRIGFDLCDGMDNAAPLSRVKTVTDYPVGRYYVDLESLENFIEPLFEYHSDDLLFVDEVGQMQLHSERFKDLVRNYVEAPNDFIGTVSQVYDDPFIDNLESNKAILLCAVKPENREQLQIALAEALSHRKTFDLLSANRQHVAFDLARGYLVNGQYISLKKLFKNAVPYIVHGKVHGEGSEFTVQGNTRGHRIYILIKTNLFVIATSLMGVSNLSAWLENVRIFNPPNYS